MSATRPFRNSLWFKDFQKVSNLRSNRFPWHIMGVGSSVDLAVPPGGSTLVLMNPTECIQTKPKINSTQKPLCLSMLGDAQWNDWMGKLQNIVNQYWNEMLPFFLAPFAMLAILGSFIANSAGLYLPPFAMFPVVFVIFLAILGGRFFIVTKSQGAAAKLKGAFHKRTHKFPPKPDSWNRNFIFFSKLVRNFLQSKRLLNKTCCFLARSGSEDSSALWSTHIDDEWYCDGGVSHCMDGLLQTQTCPYCTYHCLRPSGWSANSRPNYHGTSASRSGRRSNPSNTNATRHSDGHDSFRCECRSNLHLYTWCTASCASPSGASAGGGSKCGRVRAWKKQCRR